MLHITRDHKTGMAVVKQVAGTLPLNSVFLGIKKDTHVDANNGKVVGFVCNCTVDGIDTECLITFEEKIYLPKSIKGKGFFHRIEEIAIKDAFVTLAISDGSADTIIRHVANDRGLVLRSNYHKMGHTNRAYRESRKRAI